MDSLYDKSQEEGGEGLKTSIASPSSSTSGGSSDESSEITTIYPFVGSVEDQFIQAGLNLTTVSELTQAVEQCKGMVLSTKEYSEERKWLVRFLIELRIRLEEAREAEIEKRILQPVGTPDYSPTKNTHSSTGNEDKKTRDKRIILGHHFVLQSSTRNILKCDRCCRNVWGILHLWYCCDDCQYKCHVRCLEKIKRKCAYVRVCENPFYSTELCPEIGLAAQGYRCFECCTLISLKNGWREARKCDYDGRYYCNSCHWDSSSIIPARVIHNWDFVERKVCCSCTHYLRLMVNRPVINLDVLNPQLFQFVADLAAVKKLRSQFLLMKQYLTTCPDGLKEKNRKKLIWSLSSHFIENPSALFSLQDLIDVHKETIFPNLLEVAEISIEHIKGCRMCRRKGYFCELCPRKKEHNDQDILFPFDNAVLVHVCGKCSAVFHRECYMKKALSTCPRCERFQVRQCVLDKTVEE